MVIGGLVPADFPSFVRVVNPAYARASHGQSRALRWAAFCKENNEQTPATAKWEDLATLDGFDMPPVMGDLDANVALELSKVLSAVSGDDAECFFAMWNGYAGMRNLTDSTTAVLRHMHIFRERVIHLRDSFEEPPSQRRPMRCWDVNLVWCMAADIYSTSVVIACDNALARTIVRNPALEAYSLSARDDLHIHEL